MVTLNFQKYKIQQQVHIYIYAFIYVGYFIKRTNEPKNKNL